MPMDEYHVEQDRRLNSFISEVATLRETVRNTKESFEELKKGQNELIAAVAKGNAFNDRLDATLSYNIESKIEAKIQPLLTPIKEELALRKEESIVRKTQIAIFAMIGAGLWSIVVIVFGFIAKIWGH